MTKYARITLLAGTKPYKSQRNVGGMCSSDGVLSLTKIAAVMAAILNFAVTMVTMDNLDFLSLPMNSLVENTYC